MAGGTADRAVTFPFIVAKVSPYDPHIIVLGNVIWYIGPIADPTYADTAI